jgi:hypothetical protein
VTSRVSRFAVAGGRGGCGASGSPEELVESWTLLGDDWKRVGNKSGATRLGFAVLLKFFELEARFPRAASDVPPGAVP